MSRFSKWFAEFRQSFKAGFLRWTPAFALVFGVISIIGLSAAHAIVRGDMVYLTIGAGGLVLLGVGLWPVRSFIPNIFGRPFNENRRT